MITYTQILEANESIKKTDIKGKDYAEVNQRIKAFRMVYPNGSIQTDIVSLEGEVVVMQSKVFNEEGTLIATGFAYEKEGSSFINKTSYIENCETSAVGRALGMCGFGIDTSIASYEEVANAQANQQEKPAKATEKQVEMIRKIYDEANIKKMVSYYKVDKLEDLSMQQASEAIAKKKGK